MSSPPVYIPVKPSMDLRFGDCLVEMPRISAGSIDLILCDLPYGVTDCKWDSVIPFERLWENYRRLLHPGGAVVLTCTQPFTSALLMSNPKQYKHCWVWDKGVAGTFATAKVCPMKVHEDILVFSPSRVPYNPQKTPRDKPIKLTKASNKGLSESAKLCHAKAEYDGKIYIDKYPESIIELSSRSEKRGLHPTQKPVALMEYLIRTYTNRGDTVLDNCMGSGTTGVAAKRLGRHFIGIENDPTHFETAKDRINE